MNAEHVFLSKQSKTVAFIVCDRKGNIIRNSSFFESGEKPKFNKDSIFVYFGRGIGFYPKEIQLEQLIWPLMFFDLSPTENKTLKAHCKFFNIETDNLDTPYGECLAIYQLYWSVMRRYKMALMGEEVVREVGGRPVQFIRNLFGI